MRLSVRHFGRFMGRAPCVSDLSRSSLAGYMRHRSAQGIADTTIERETAKLVTLANAAASQGLIGPLNFTVKKIPPGPPMALNKRQIRALFREVRCYDRTINGYPGALYLTAYLMVCWYSGERPGTVHKMGRDDFDFGGRFLWRHVWATFRYRKGHGKTLIKRLPRPAAVACEKYFALCPCGHPFMIVAMASLYPHLNRVLKAAG
jgi:integrase